MASTDSPARPWAGSSRPAASPRTSPTPIPVSFPSSLWPATGPSHWGSSSYATDPGDLSAMTTTPRTSTPTVDIHRELDPDTLVASARASAGLTDFGDGRFLEPMARFLEAAAEEANLNLQGGPAREMTVGNVLV